MVGWDGSGEHSQPFRPVWIQSNTSSSPSSASLLLTSMISRPVRSRYSSSFNSLFCASFAPSAVPTRIVLAPPVGLTALPGTLLLPASAEEERAAASLACRLLTSARASASWDERCFFSVALVEEACWRVDSSVRKEVSCCERACSAASSARREEMRVSAAVESLVGVRVVAVCSNPYLAIWFPSVSSACRS